MRNISAIVAIVVVCLFVASLSFFRVDQRQNAIIFQLGEVKEVITKPGLKWKWPFIQNVRFYDTRILTLDTQDSERFITSEKKPLLVDFFVKWRIVDPQLYYVSVAGDERRAQERLWQTVNAGLQEEFSKRTVHEVVSGERDKIMDVMRTKADQDARKMGAQIVDVRLKRVDLPDEVSLRVYDRMRAERKQVANELRSKGSAEGEKIRADADKQKEIILANAYRDAQRIKGEGDAKAASIYAKAFNEDAEFYAFYRSLEAYRQSFKNKNDMLVIEPNSEFFKYLKSMRGR